MYIIKVEDRLVGKTRGSAGMGGDKKVRGTFMIKIHYSNF